MKTSMKTSILAVISSFAIGFALSAFASTPHEVLKDCKPSGAKCGLDSECCSKFCKASNTLRTCK